LDDEARIPATTTGKSARQASAKPVRRDAHATGGRVEAGENVMKPCEKKRVVHLGLVRVVALSMVAFLGLLGAAITVYPGRDAAAGGYRFCHDFISALGMTRTEGGLDNAWASVLFNSGLGLAMLALIPYWYVRSDSVRGPRVVRWAAFLLCAGFSLGVFGVALTPYDRHPHLHNVCIYTAFALIVPGILIMSMGAEKAFSGWRYKMFWVIFAVLLLSAEGVLTAMVKQRVLPSRPVNPVLQKINVMAFIAWVAADLWLFRAYLNRLATSGTCRRGQRHCKTVIAASAQGSFR